MKTLRSHPNWLKGIQLLNTKYPIICGAMTWISDTKMVKAVADAGGMGTLAGGNMPLDLFENEINRLKQFKINYAVNLITIAPNYIKQLDVSTSLKVPHIVFAGSFPRQNEVRIAKESGAKVICFASTESIAQRMIEYGADALILEGNEAGGHIGHVSTIVLIQQVLFKFPTSPKSYQRSRLL